MNYMYIKTRRSKVYMRFLKKENMDKGVKNVNEDDGLYWDVLGCNCSVPGCTGCTGLWWTVLGCNGLMDCTGQY